jgi:tRNA dimethylallyltransferase
VGGTGLYLRGVLRGVFTGPAADWAIRRRLEAEAGEHPPGWLHERLRAVDPAAAAALHPHDTRRLVRALEVFELTGRPLSEQQTQPPLPEADRPRHVYWLSPPRDWLYERINRRVDAMLSAGLVDEVRSLLAGPQPLGRTARQALGYREIVDFLESRATLDEATDLIRRRTRQFAKRQHTWFRNLVECRAVTTDGSETPALLAGRIASLAGTRTGTGRSGRRLT